MINFFVFEEIYYLNGDVPITVEFRVPNNGDVSEFYVWDAFIIDNKGEQHSFSDLTKVGEYVRTKEHPLGVWKDLESILEEWGEGFLDKWQEEINVEYTEERDDDE